MKKVIITGAGGFVGSELTKKMVYNDIEVTAISDYFLPTFPINHLINKIEIKIDMNCPEKLLKIIPDTDYDAFYHLAWKGVNGSDKANVLVQIDNMKIALNCANIANKCECKKFLCAGTIAEQSISSLSKIEYTSNGMIYGVAKHCTHLMLETFCKNIGLDFIWMQFSNIYGPQNKTGNLVSYTISQLAQGCEATFGPALQPYDFIFVDDLIEAIYQLGNNRTNNNYYIIGSGEPRFLKDYLLEIGELLGKLELIKIGVKADDGIKYSMDMFDASSLKKDIGDYISRDFTEGIKYTLANY